MLFMAYSHASRRRVDMFVVLGVIFRRRTCLAISQATYIWHDTDYALIQHRHDLGICCVSYIISVTSEHDSRASAITCNANLRNQTFDT